MTLEIISNCSTETRYCRNSLGLLENRYNWSRSFYKRRLSRTLWSCRLSAFLRASQSLLNYKDVLAVENSGAFLRTRPLEEVRNSPPFSRLYLEVTGEVEQGSMYDAANVCGRLSLRWRRRCGISREAHFRRGCHVRREDIPLLALDAVLRVST